MFKRMPTEKVVYTSGGSSLLTAIAIVFVILKLTGTTAVATWSWWWVLAPLWLPVLSRYIPFKEYRQKHGEPLHPHDEMAESDCWSQLCVRHGEDVVNKVWSRHLASEFKRKKAPIYISRELYE